MGQLLHVLKHEATIVALREADGAGWVEGERTTAPVPVRGQTFPCVLFLPLGTEDEGQPRGRKITRPTLLWEPFDVEGAELEVVTADHELLILAPELAGYFEQVDGEPEGTGRWQVEGAPQPFGPPGSVIGAQATVKQVTES